MDQEENKDGLTEKAQSSGPGTEEKPAKKKKPPWFFVLIALLVVAVGVGGFLGGRAVVNATAEKDPVGTGNNRIGYDANVILGDADELNEAIRKMQEQANEPGIALEYKEQMISDNGKDFACYIANSAKNAYDMFITIYADQSLTDELFLSKLMPPGSRFETISFERKLDPGTYTGYLVYTQVKDEEVETDGESTLTQVIHAQLATTIQIVVNE